MAIIELREVAQDLHHHLELVDVGATNFIRQHVDAALHQFQLAIEERLNNVSSIVQTQIAHQAALAIAAQSSPLDDPWVPSIIETVVKLRRL